MLKKKRINVKPVFSVSIALRYVWPWPLTVWVWPLNLCSRTVCPKHFSRSIPLPPDILLSWKFAWTIPRTFLRLSPYICLFPFPVCVQLSVTVYGLFVVFEFTFNMWILCCIFKHCFSRPRCRWKSFTRASHGTKSIWVWTSTLPTRTTFGNSSWQYQ